MTLECVHNNNIAVFVVQYNYVVGPMARPEPAGSGRAWASNMTIMLWVGPGLDILFAGRAGPGPHNSVCEPGPGQVCTTAVGPGRAWASTYICGPGLGLNFRPVQGPIRCTFPLIFTFILLSQKTPDTLFRFFHQLYTLWVTSASGRIDY